jgi:elongator complex protein 4
VSRKTAPVEVLNERVLSGTIEGNEPANSVAIGAGTKQVADGSGSGAGEKMKIAWRYERLGEFGPKGTSSPSSL